MFEKEAVQDVLILAEHFLLTTPSSLQPKWATSADLSVLFSHWSVPSKELPDWSALALQTSLDCPGFVNIPRPYKGRALRAHQQ